MDGATQDRQEQQGKALIDHAIENGVKYFAYSSVERSGRKDDDDPTYIPHFRSKFNIEKHLLEKSENGKKMSYTIIRTVTFMDGLTPGFMGKVFVTMTQIGNQGFLRPEHPAFKYRAINLAGNELTFEELNVFRERMGYPVPTIFGFVTRVLKWMLTEVNIVYRWFDKQGYGADIPALRMMHPGLMNLGDWLGKESGFVKR
ncbi:MAG: hypothetical protein Q9166_003993 [cf. Caloplaca sp. 2 TL-2023]